MARHEYELVVIGAGAAGSTAAETAARAGRRVALVERDRLGGTCLNYGCDPTKALLHVARQLFDAQHGERFGLHIPRAEVDWPGVQRWVEEVITRIRGGSAEAGRAALEEKGIALYLGEARFRSAHEVAVGEEVLWGAQIIIATGGAAMVPPIEGLKEAGFLTNVEAVALPALPRRLAIIGGGPIGLEFAQLFHRFGVAVTVLEMGERLLMRDDRELAEQLCGLLGEAGIRLETEVKVREVRWEDGEKRLRVQCRAREEETLVVDEILLATGRAPVLEPLKLAAAGVELSDDGIVVDRTLRTSVPHIWAVGDVTGLCPFTHVAAHHGGVAARNAFAAKPVPYDGQAMPWVTYTDPELAHIGQTEEELKEAGIKYRVGRLALDQLDRARIEGETAGMMKLLVGADGMILGGHLLAPRAGDLLAPVVVAMRAGLTVEALAATILPYPTMAEGVRWAAGSVETLKRWNGGESAQTLKRWNGGREGRGVRRRGRGVGKMGSFGVFVVGGLGW